MKFQIGWLALLAATQLPTCLASGASPNMTLADVPQCGLTCTAEVVPTSECHSVQNTTCFCTSQSLAAAMQACVMKSCTVIESLDVRRFADVSCGRISVDEGVPASQAIMSIFTGLAFVFFILRVITRWQKGFSTSWGADDWLIVPAVVITAVNFSFAIIASSSGLSRDMWWLTPDEINTLLYSYFVAEILYLMIVSFTKLSVLAFYLQIFPSRTFRYWNYFLVACNVGFMISLVLATTFQCWPVSGAWLAWDGTFEGRCINSTPLIWAGAILTITLDAATLVLPMPVLWKLNMSLKKRLQIMLMFSVGVFVTITSMVRLKFIASLATSTNPSSKSPTLKHGDETSGIACPMPRRTSFGCREQWYPQLQRQAADRKADDFKPVGLWSIIEINVGIMCACLPAVRALLVQVMPRVLGFSSNRSRTGYVQDGGGLSGYGLGGSALKSPSAQAGSQLSAAERAARSRMTSSSVRMSFKSGAHTGRTRRRDEDSFIELDDMSDEVDHGSLNKDDVVLVGPELEKGAP